MSKNGVFKHNIIPLDQLEDTSISYLEIIFLCKCSRTSRKWTLYLSRKRKPHLPWSITNFKHHILSILNIVSLNKVDWYSLQKIDIIIYISTIYKQNLDKVALVCILWIKSIPSHMLERKMAAWPPWNKDFFFFIWRHLLLS